MLWIEFLYNVVLMTYFDTWYVAVYDVSNLSLVFTFRGCTFNAENWLFVSEFNSLFLVLLTVLSQTISK